MQKKKVICAGIGVVVVIAVILGGIAIHRDSEAVETATEAVAPIIEEETPTAAEEAHDAVEAETETEETTAEETAAQIETEVSEAEETAEVEPEEPEAEETVQDMAEVPEGEGLEEIDTYLYTTADLNMREGATTESEVIGSIPYGTKIHVTARTADNWYLTEGENVGYVSGKYLSEEEPAKQTAQDSTQQQAQSTGQGSTPPNGISQEEGDQFREAYRSVLGVYPEDMPPYDPSQETPMPMTGGGGYSIYR